MKRFNQLPLLESLEQRELFSVSIPSFGPAMASKPIGPSIVMARNLGPQVPAPAPVLSPTYGGDIDTGDSSNHWFSLAITARNGRMLTGTVHLGKGYSVEKIPFVGMTSGDKFAIVWGSRGNLGGFSGTISPDGYSITGPLINKSFGGNWGNVTTNATLVLDWNGVIPV